MEAVDGIRLYDERTAPALDLGGVAEYLRARMGCPSVVTRGPFAIEYCSAEQLPALGERIARLKVRDLDAPPTQHEPAYAEMEFERRRLANKDRGPFGVLYDGFGFQRVLRSLLPAAEVRLNRVHVAFTNRTIGTWDENDRRYHLRAIILGMPAIVSTTGLVEAPAKPREFYLARQQLGITARSEVAQALLKERFKGQFLDHDDERLTEVAKGYAMQAVAFQATGEGFCEDPDCRLFNAHWQAELLRAQLGGPPDYCVWHEELLNEIRRQSCAG